MAAEAKVSAAAFLFIHKYAKKRVKVTVICIIFFVNRYAF